RGTAYTSWITETLPGSDGRADLCAHFFLRAAQLIGDHGTFGLIATNTIAQGDTRSSGLAQLVGRGYEIYDAFDGLPWPGSAAVVVSIRHVCKGRTSGFCTQRFLNDRPVSIINSRLRARPERPDSVQLHANRASAFL